MRRGGGGGLESRHRLVGERAFAEAGIKVGQPELAAIRCTWPVGRSAHTRRSHEVRNRAPGRPKKTVAAPVLDPLRLSESGAMRTIRPM